MSNNIIDKYPDSLAANKLRAMVLMYSQKYDKAIEHGSNNANVIECDGDFEELLDDEEFKAIVHKLLNNM